MVTKPNLEYLYDAMGNRITKIVKPAGSTSLDWVYTHYVRDAQGNVMATYKKENINQTTSYQLTERHIYGSSRVGIDNKAIELIGYTAPSDDLYRHQIGLKNYELTNHLGNVNAVLTDRKIPRSTNGLNIDYYMPDIVSATDYYAFGAPMPGRSFSGEKYRFGFNGKENDAESNTQDYGMRIYDTRLGRFLSVDPLSNEYPFYTPYQFAGNNCIFSVDVDGLEPNILLNKSEELLHTPYEFGGKNPAPGLVGTLDNEEGEKFWSNQLMPFLNMISNYHPEHYSSSKPRAGTENCNPNEKHSIYNKIVQEAHSKFFSLTKGKYSLGVDCSGFVCISYKSDKELLFDANRLNTGSAGQLSVFQSAQKDKKAIVHKNFNLVSMGDFIYMKGHVMIATGDVQYDKNGNVTKFQTYEANSTGAGSIMKWRKVESKYTIAHPFRTSDYIPNGLDGSENCSDSENCQIDRLKNNLIQY